MSELASITLGAGGSRAMIYGAAGNVTRDARTGTDHGYTYDAAERMASYSLNGMLQAEYQYSAAGQQVVRRLLPSGEQIHAVHDAAGQRIAEYRFNPATGTSTLIREYIWAAGQIVGVFEGGQLYLVRTDHIGRPVFATNDAGAVVWSATYYPFGGVRVTQGTPIALRFPGQWFQAESGLHQNWMRDYDPTTGRYIQPDPLGLIDGASVYGYARANPGRYVDVRGLASCTYSISTKTLSCTSDSGISMTLDPGIVRSGIGECQDNPDCSEIPNTGPIPPGTYDMIRSGKFGGSYWLDEGYIDRFFSDRSGFFLHEGTRSLGCITVERGDPAWDRLMALLDGDTYNTMTVTE